MRVLNEAEATEAKKRLSQLTNKELLKQSAVTVYFLKLGVEDLFYNDCDDLETAELERRGLGVI